MDELKRQKQCLIPGTTEYECLNGKENDLIFAVKKRYVQALKRSKKRRYGDLRAIVNSISYADFKENCDLKREAAKKSDHSDIEACSQLKQQSIENFDNCVRFIQDCTKLQLEAFKASELIDASVIIERRAAEIFPRTGHMTSIPHTAATDALPAISKHNIVSQDSITGNVTAMYHNVSMLIESFDRTRNQFRPSVDKALTACITQIVKRENLNALGNENAITKGQTAAKISYRQFAKMQAYDITQHDESDAEIKRAKKRMEHFVAKTKADLNTLQKTTFTWKAKIQGKTKLYSVSPIQLVIYERGSFTVYFTPAFLACLANTGLFTQYSDALYRVDGSAYSIGRKMLMHSSIRNNQKQGTADHIKIGTLLSASTIISYDELKEQHDERHWPRKIKEPFEQALANLKQEGVLKNFEILAQNPSHQNTSKQTIVSNYIAYSECLVYYEICGLSQ